MLSLIIGAAAAVNCAAAPINAPDMTVTGQAKYTKAIFHLYDASLCARDTQAPAKGEFAIVLDYARSFKSAQMVKATIVEMPRLSGRPTADFEPLRPLLQRCFPDVKKGDRIVGMSPEEGRAQFFHNGKETCLINWKNFRHDFFGIWLSDNSRVSKNAKKLRGEK